MRTWPAIDVELDAPGAADLLQAFLLDHDLAGVDETSPARWRCFFRTGAARDAAATALAGAFPRLAPSPVNVDDEDWVARSQAALRAVRVGRLTIAPPWDTGEPPNETLVIRPAMGFGTGHHATTRLCPDALQRLDVSGQRVLDVGTGSGVLAIAASRLGALPVHAIDDDPDTLDAARANLTLNPGTVITFALGDFRTLALAPAATLLRALRPGGHLVLSGFPIEGAAEVRAAFAVAALVREAHQEEWAALTLYTPASHASGAPG